MQATEIGVLAGRLNELAEAFNHRPPSPNALKVWLDVLKEFQIGEVQSVLTDLPKRAIKFPAPADVWKACNERRTERIENEARTQRAMPVIRPTHFPVSSAIGRQELAKIKAILSKPRPSKRAWIDKIFKREAEQDPTLGPYAIALAHDAHKKLSRSRPPVDIEL